MSEGVGPPREKKKLSQWAKCKNRLIGLDFFGQPFMFLMPDGDSEFKTILGAFCSVIVIILVLIYAYDKFTIFLGREDYIIQFQKHEEAFSPAEHFGFDEGFMVAAAVIGGDLD